MAFDREQFVEDLKKSYEIYYDLYPNAGVTDLPLEFRANFHSVGENYFLVKSAKIWTSESNEYVYIFSDLLFDEETVKKCVDYALEDGLNRVTPHKNHHSSNIITIFVADEVSPSVRRYIARRKFSKSYHMSLYGFTLLKSAFIDLSKEEYGTNAEGHDLVQFFKKLFPKKQFLKK